jgi:hypothetical protein
MNWTLKRIASRALIVAALALTLMFTFAGPLLAVGPGGGGSGGGGTGSGSVPEMDPNAILGAMTLLAGGALILIERCRSVAPKAG